MGHPAMELSRWTWLMDELGWESFGMMTNQQRKFRKDGWAISFYRAVHVDEMLVEMWREDEVKKDKYGMVVERGHESSIALKPVSGGVSGVDDVYNTLQVFSDPLMVPLLVGVEFAAPLLEFWGKS